MIALRVRKPVDEWDQAENVSPPDVNPVRFEQVEAVGGINDHPTTRAQHSDAFSDCRDVVGDVFDHLVQRLNEASKVGGEVGIRTLDTRKGITVFETAAIDHSATSPNF